MALVRSVEELVGSARRGASEVELRVEAERLGWAGEIVARGRSAAGAGSLTVDVERAAAAARFLTAAMRPSPNPPEVAAHALELARRQLELARRAVVAKCVPEESRDQSAQWREATFAALQVALMVPVRGCVPAGARDALPNLEVKLHIGRDGRVELAGPLELASLDPHVVEFTHCAVQLCEKVAFPPPEGLAIVVVPFARGE